MKVSLDKATVAQLRAFSDQYGLDHADRTTAAQLRALIAEALDVTEIDVEDEDQEPAPKRQRKEAGPPDSAPKTTFRVLIQEQDPQFVPGGDQPVWLGCNGDGIFVPRGEICDVPLKFKDSLLNATTIIYRQILGEDGQPAGIGDPREVSSYPYQIFD